MRGSKKEISFSWRTHILVLALLLAVTLIASFWLGLIQSFRIIFGAVYTFFLPGYILIYTFFQNRKTNWLETLTLSISISICVVTLIIFYLSLMHIAITTKTIGLTVLGTITFGLVVIFKKLMIKPELIPCQD